MDVLVKSPYARDAGPNPTGTGVAKKQKDYAKVANELEAIGIQYRPFVYSTYGAPDPLALQTLEAAARKAANCPRAGSPGAALARWRLRIAVAIWRGNARMMHRCLTPLADPERDIEKYRVSVNAEAEVEEEIYEDLLFGEAWE